MVPRSIRTVCLIWPHTQIINALAVCMMCVLHVENRFIGYGLASIPDYKTWKPRRKVYEPSFNKR